MGKIIHALGRGRGTRPLPPSDPRDRARTQAERIIKDAKDQALRLQQTAHSQGHLAGFREGFKRGYKDGLAEAGESQVKKQSPGASFDEDAPLVASARGKVVHLRECRHAMSITPDNGISFDSLDAVTAAGLSYCRACQPDENMRPAPSAASDDAAGA